MFRSHKPTFLLILIIVSCLFFVNASHGRWYYRSSMRSLRRLVFNLQNTVRSIDGSGNNLQNPMMNAASTPFKRIGRVTYTDGRDIPVG